MSLSEQFKIFSERYPKESTEPFRATDTSQIITRTLPGILRERLQLGEKYRIYGSTGRGRWAEIPWVAILDKEITKSTEDGYYVVILFDKEIKNIYLSLAVGWHQFEWEYGIRDSRAKIQDACKYYAHVLTTKLEGFKEGTITLGAENILGKGYEMGCVFSKEYSISDIEEPVLLNDIQHVLSSYQELKDIVGNSILNLEIDSVSSSDERVRTFKKRIAEKTLTDDKLAALAQLVQEANAAPPPIRTVLKKEIVRNKTFAAVVKQREDFICEVCKRLPFMQRNGAPYAEADHIIPLGGTERGKDSPDNMRCLCAQCHAILTHGSPKEIEQLLNRTTAP